ncbi:GTP cyclohydrolase II RibA [Kitasatospora sp. NPDC051853]|uniref:GTP cyclohydrolase II RibA n=1 Tax=Kitasatospora sp. NPDC051853 TaxID=3364058 RepID=UPI0037B769BD
MPEQLDPATVRTTVRIPLTFPDGYRVQAEVTTFHGLADGAEHLALRLGEPGGRPGGEQPGGGGPLVRLHSECLTGDVFGSDRCDCGPQLREAVERIATDGGYLLYLRQEGRGIGLYNKLDAYALQDRGLDTYAANAALGLPEDGRDYAAAAQMLAALGAPRIRLLSNNPDKAAQLTAHGIEVTEHVPTGVHVSPANLRYLRAKVEHTHHAIPLAELAG